MKLSIQNNKFFYSTIINILPILIQILIYIHVLTITNNINLGNYFLVTTFISFVSLFLDLGLSTATIKYISEFKHDKIFVGSILVWSIQTRILILIIVTIIFYLLKSVILDYFTIKENLSAYILAFFSTIINVSISIVNSIHIGINKLKQLAVYQCIINLSLYILVFTNFYFNGFNLYNYTSILFFHSLLSFFLSILFIYKTNLLNFKIKYNLFNVYNYLNLINYISKESTKSRSGKSFFNFLFYITFGLVISGVTQRVDILLLKKTLSIESVSYYGFFLKFVMPINLIVSIMSTNLSPKINQKNFSLNNYLNEIKFKKYFIYILLILFSYSLFGVYFITFFLRHVFLNYWYIGTLFVLFSSISIFTNPISLYGYNFGFDKYYPLINIIQFIILIFIYQFLVLKYGLIMSILAYGCNFVIGALFLFFLFKKCTKLIDAPL